MAMVDGAKGQEGSPESVADAVRKIGADCSNFDIDIRENQMKAKSSLPFSFGRQAPQMECFDVALRRLDMAM